MALPVVRAAASASPETFAAISWLPVETSVTLRTISEVVADCSSTAAAMVACNPSMRAMTSVICSMAPAAAPASAWVALMRVTISSVARAVCCASSLTSPATTAKPLPISPARAASMVAFSASRFVCSAMEVMSLTTSPISREEAERRSRIAEASAALLTAAEATEEASAVEEAISRIAALISSPAAATVEMDVLISSVAAETTCDWPADSWAPEDSSADTRVSSCAEEPSRWASPPICCTAARKRPVVWSRARAIAPISSRLSTPTVAVRSPSATCARTSVTRCSGATMLRRMTSAAATARARPATSSTSTSCCPRRTVAANSCPAASAALARSVSSASAVSYALRASRFGPNEAATAASRSVAARAYSARSASNQASTCASIASTVARSSSVRAAVRACSTAAAKSAWRPRLSSANSESPVMKNPRSSVAAALAVSAACCRPVM